MKNIFKSSLLLALAGTFLGSSALAKDDEAAGKEPEAKKATITFAVDGMSCVACTSKVEAALEKLDGVEVTEVSAPAKQAIVTIDAAKTKKSDVAEAISKTGFLVKGEKLSLPVSGMACVSCSGKVTTALTAVDGVKEAEVSHEDAKAVVVIDSEKTSKEAVTAVIEDLGYKVGAAAKG